LYSEFHIAHFGLFDGKELFDSLADDTIGVLESLFGSGKVLSKIISFLKELFKRMEGYVFDFEELLFVFDEGLV
jgi:hypothetical protein